MSIKRIKTDKTSKKWWWVKNKTSKKCILLVKKWDDYSQGLIIIEIEQLKN